MPPKWKKASADPAATRARSMAADPGKEKNRVSIYWYPSFYSFHLKKHWGLYPKLITAVIYGFRSKLECLSLNTRLGRKGLPGTNTQAYYGNSKLRHNKFYDTASNDCKRFINSCFFVNENPRLLF
jgi:hypothetical protein